MYIDSHCHLDCLDLSDFDNDLAHAIQAAKDQQVEYMLCVCIDLENFPKVLNIAEQYPHISASVGVHPNAEDCEDPTVERLISLAQSEKIAAIGETGLDYFRSEGDLTWQRERFICHINAAKQCQKPLIIHTREAQADTVAIMQQERASEAGGVMHCFTEDWEMAKQCLDMGFYISFSGILTFKNAHQIQDVAKKVPADRMLIETDSPYLAPVPYRGKSNQPAYVPFVAQKLAELRNESVEVIAHQTTDNFYQLFAITKQESLGIGK